MENDKSVSSVMENHLNKVRALRPIDDLCGSVFFQDIGCTQLLLREIMEKPDMTIQEMVPQSVFPNFFGRGGRLDVVAFDAVSGAYNLEFQSDREGAVLDRAFFNYALLARHLIDKGTKFKDFPCTSIIFVQEEDFFHANQTKAKVRFILDGDPPVPLKSKLNIVYVNTNVKEYTTTLSKILHDLRCASPEEMLVPQFAARMEQVKNPKGKEMEFMCGALCEALAMEREEGREEGRMEGREEGREEGRKEMAKETASAMFETGTPYETIQLLFQEILSREELSQIRRLSVEHHENPSLERG